MLEGALPYVTRLVLETLIDEGHLTLPLINESIQRTFNRLRIDKKNRPSELIFSGNGTKRQIKFRMSSAQSWAFFRYLPVSIGEFVPKDSLHWRLMLYLQEITDIVLSLNIAESQLDYFDYLYYEFLVLFRRLYPNSSIRPKMHFQLHFRSIVRRSGPPRTHWSMNFERKNGQVKRPSHTMNNFQNPLFTLSKKIQTVALSYRLSPFKHDHVDFPFSYQMNVTDYNTIDFSPYLSSPGQSYVTVTSTISFNGARYRKGDFLLLEREPQGYLFGKIDCILCEDPNEPVFLVNLFSTITFDPHIYSYCVERKIPSKSRFCTVPNLMDFHALDGLEIAGCIYIRLKYNVC